MQTDVIHNNSMKVITISGHAGHGKDTVALMMKDKLEDDGHSVLITHYADLLKYICRSFFNWNGEKNEAGRSLLQHVGTDVIRKRYPDLWVDFVLMILDMFNGSWDYVIIPDARFPNEIEKMRGNGFEMIHVRVVREHFQSRLTQEQQTHESETALDNVRPDYCIHNYTGLTELRAEIDKFVEDILYGNND